MGMNPIGLASAITDLKAAEVQQKVACLVLARALEAGRQNGEAVVSLLESAAAVQSAAAGLSAAVAGLGEQLDVWA